MIRKFYSWLFPDDGAVTLSPDLFPTRRLRHWIAARGRPSVASALAAEDGVRRRRLSLELSSHGRPSTDSGEDRGGVGSVRPRLSIVKGRRSA
jgi:hypothetical protein